MRLCKCGNPVRKGIVKLFYVNKKGDRREYVYERNLCRECTNADKRRFSMQRHKKEFKYF